MLLDGTDKHASSTAVGDAQHLLTPAQAFLGICLLHHSMVGDTVCWCRWAMSVHSVFAGGGRWGGGVVFAKKKTKIVAHLLFCCHGADREFLWDSDVLISRLAVILMANTHRDSVF